MNLKLGLKLGWAMLGYNVPGVKAIVTRQIEHEKEVIQVMTVLPGKYRYKQVEAAINASGIRPNDLYYDLAANQRTMALERFYEALGDEQIKRRH